MPRRTVTYLAAGGVLALLPTVSAIADETYSEVSGSVTLEMRAFQRSPTFSEQTPARLHPALIAEPEFLYEWNDGDDRIDIKPYLRIDAHDPDRNLVDLREARWLHLADKYELVVGLNKVFWGVTESQHLVDIINQTDAAADVDGEDKLGQPMVNLKLLQDWGDLDFFVMPFFRDRTFVGTSGRLRGGTVIATDRAQFEHEWKRFHPDLAVRASAVVGQFDLGLSHFHGTSREPNFSYDVGVDRLIPRYEIIDQTGLDAQATLGDWLLKLESIYRTGQDDGFAAVTTGFEYTLYGQFNEARGDIGLLAEYHYDGRSDAAPATLFDNDAFAGVRFTLNDEADTSLLAGVLYDYESQVHSVSAEFETRLSDTWFITLDARLYGGAEPDDLQFGARADNHLQMALSRYF